MIEMACEVLPDQVTLVPELPGEVTTTGGLDCTKNLQAIAQAIERLKSAGMAVSLFIDPEEDQIRAADDLGAMAIELNTSRYSDATLTNRPLAAGMEELRGCAASCGIRSLTQPADACRSRSDLSQCSRDRGRSNRSSS